MANKFDKTYFRPNKINEKIVSELFSKIDEMNTDALTRFTLDFRIPLSLTDNEGNNLIHKVILNNNPTNNEVKKLNIIKYLYNNNVNPNAPNKDNQTPLHLACNLQLSNICNYLIKKGVDINYVDNYGNTCLHYLISGKLRVYIDETRKSIIDIPEKYVEDKYSSLRKIKKEIWNIIKDSKYIKSITETIKNSVSTNNRAINIIEDFNADFREINLEDLKPEDKLENLKMLKGNNIQKFETEILQKWDNFEGLSDGLIVNHQKNTNSWPQNYNEIPNSEISENRAIIKNGNYEDELIERTNNEIKVILDKFPNNRPYNIDFNIKTKKYIDELFTKNTNFISNRSILTDFDEIFRLTKTLPGPVQLELNNIADNYKNYIKKIIDNDNAIYKLKPGYFIGTLTTDIDENIIYINELKDILIFMLNHLESSVYVNRNDEGLIREIYNQFENKAPGTTNIIYNGNGGNILNTNPQFINLRTFINNFIKNLKKYTNPNNKEFIWNIGKIGVNELNPIEYRFEDDDSDEMNIFNNYNDTSKKLTRQLQNSKISVNATSNILDWENHYFIGGCREMIINEINYSEYFNKLYSLKIDDIPLFIYNVIINDLTNDTMYELDNYRVYNCKQLIYIYIHLIISYIANLNNTTIVSIDNLEIFLIEHIKNNCDINNYFHILQMIKNRTENIELNFKNKNYIVSFLYELMCELECQVEPSTSNLEGNINQIFLYLLAGVQNYQTDFYLSLQQSSRLAIFGYKFLPGDTLPIDNITDFEKWIHILLNENNSTIYNSNQFISNEDKSDLEIIKIMTKNYFNRIDLFDKYTPEYDKLLKMTLKEAKRFPPCEILSMCIVNYYNSMKQKPILQHIVDTISLIRYFYIIKDKSKSNREEIIISRLKGLYINPKTYEKNLENGYITNNPINDDTYFFNYNYLTEDLTTNPYNSKVKLDTNFINMFGKDTGAQLEIISEFQIPSQINFYLSNKYSDFNGSHVNDDNSKYLKQKFYLNKLIEANCFGLNFLGVLPKLKPKNYSIDLNYFTNIDNPETFLYNNNNNPNLYRPAYYENYENFLKNLSNIILNLESKVLELLQNILIEFKDIKQSKNYSKFITFIYPILVALNNHKLVLDNLIGENKFESYLEDIINSFNKINSYVYLYYYLNTKEEKIKLPNLNTKEEKIKLPNFLYHQLDINKNYPISLYKTNSNLEMLYPNNKSIENVDIGKENINKGEISDDDLFRLDNTKILKSLLKEDPNIKSFNNIVMNNILDGNYFKVKKTIRESYRQDKKSRVPPSLNNSLPLFYRYNTIKLLKEEAENLQNIDIKNIDINKEYKKIIGNTNNKQIYNLYKLELNMKIVLELLSLYFKNEVYKIGAEIVGKVISNFNIDIDIDSNIDKDEFLYLIDKKPYIIDLAQDISIDESTIRSAGIINEDFNNIFEMNFKSFSKYKFDKSEYFILYPNDYNRLQKVQELYKIEIDNNLLQNLLIYNIDLNKQNMNGDLALKYIIKSLNYKIIGKLLKNDEIIGLKHYLQNKFNNYLESMFKTHIENYTNNITNNFKEQINYFISTQHDEIITLKENYNFNVLRNLKNSFIHCNILIQKFISGDTNIKFNFNNRYKNFKEAKNIIENELNYFTSDNYISYFINNLETLKTYNDNPILSYDYLEDINKNIETFFMEKYINFKNEDNIVIVNYYKKYTYEIILFLTKQYICVPLEMILRKMLFMTLDTYDMATTNTLKNKIEAIEWILGLRIPKDSNDGEINDISVINYNSRSIKEILYNDIAERFVKNYTEIFESNIDSHEYKNVMINNDIESILKTFIEVLIKNSPYKLNNEFKKIFIDEVIPYFRDHIPRIIINWYISIENIFLYILNLFRILKCYNLINE